MTRALAGTLLMAGALFASVNLDTIRAEPDPEKRARAALDYAGTAISNSRSAYMESHYNKAMALVKEVGAAADLCLESLNQTGKDARRSPKAFKRAEIQLRELLRRLRSLEGDFGVDDRPAVQAVEQRLQEIHDDLIGRIMGKKK